MPLIIIVAILLFIAFLMFCRVKLFITYDDDFRFKVKYLFITYRIKTEAEGKTKEKAQEKPKRSFKDVKAFINSFRKIYGYAKDMIAAAFKRLRIDRLEIKLIICEEEAAKTAIYYGEACAVVYSAAAFLSNAIKVKKQEISINPQFSGGASSINFNCVLSMRLGSILSVAVKGSAVFVIAQIKRNQIKIPKKDGAVK